MGFRDAKGGTGIFLPVDDHYLSRTKPVPLDGNNIMSWVVKFDTEASAPNLKLNGYGLNWGTVQFEEVETSNGTVIRGSLKADLLKIPIH